MIKCGWKSRKASDFTVREAHAFIKKVLLIAKNTIKRKVCLVAFLIIHLL